MTDADELDAWKDALAQRIRRLREAAGLRPQDAAALLGWRRWQWERLERGDRDPQFTSLCNVARVLGVSVSEVLRGVGPEP